MFTIGHVSVQTGIHIETIRYYEKSGFISPVPRAENGRRIFGEKQLRQLRFLKKCRDLGFTLSQISELLSLAESRDASCKKVNVIANQHLKTVFQKITELNEIKTRLEVLVASCDTKSGVCNITESLLDD